MVDLYAAIDWLELMTMEEMKKVISAMSAEMANLQRIKTRLEIENHELKQALARHQRTASK